MDFDDLNDKLENLKANYDSDADARNKIHILLAKRQSNISNLSYKDNTHKLSSTAKLSSIQKEKEINKTDNSLHNKDDKDNVIIGEILKTNVTKQTYNTLSLNPSNIELIRNRYGTEGNKSDQSKIEYVKTDYNLINEIKEDIDNFQELEKSQLINKEKSNILSNDS